MRREIHFEKLEVAVKRVLVLLAMCAAAATVVAQTPNRGKEKEP